MESNHGLLELCSAAARRADDSGTPTTVKWREKMPYTADPFQLIENYRDSAEKIFFWHGINPGRWIIGLDSEIELPGHGSERFRKNSRACQWWSNRCFSGGPDADISGNVVVGQFSFNSRMRAEDADGGPSADSRLWIPSTVVTGSEHEMHFSCLGIMLPQADPAQLARRMTRRIDSIRTLRVTQRRGYTSSADNSIRMTEFPPAEEWVDTVGRAIKEIRCGRFDKVVLARSLELASMVRFDPLKALHRISDENLGQAVVFAVKGSDGWFIGATPEYLVRLRGDRVFVPAVAASAPRGRTAEEDGKLERELLSDRKSIEEHRIVLEWVKKSLKFVCSDISADAVPRVLKLPLIQHLYADVHARLPTKGYSPAQILGLVERLHPTPAIGGSPRHSALGWIQENEPIQRGWYSGPIGWADDSGGEFAVAIRSLRIRGRFATAYAGAGIVADSDPWSEYRETATKLRTALNSVSVKYSGEAFAPWGPKALKHLEGDVPDENIRLQHPIEG